MIDKKEFRKKVEEKLSEAESFYGDTQVITGHTVFELIDQLDEQEKIIVPDYVYDHIKKHKNDKVSISYALSSLSSAIDYNDVIDKKVNKYFYDGTNEEAFKNQETYAKAWMAYPNVETIKWVLKLGKSYLHQPLRHSQLDGFGSLTIYRKEAYIFADRDEADKHKKIFGGELERV